MTAELPFIDRHEIAVAAPAETVWARLCAAVGGNAMLGRRAAFPRREEEPPRRLLLAGRHPFATYELRFELTPADGETVVCATTHARFTAGLGRIYRALVIGSGGHAWVVRRFLRRLAR